MPSIRYRVVLPLFVCGALVASANIGWAQQSDQNSSSDDSTTSGHPGPPRGGPPTAAGELARLTRVLSLTDEQKAAILPILEAKHTKIDALMKSSTDRVAIGQQMHTITNASNAELRALLTETQQKIFDSMRPPRPPMQGEGNRQGEATLPQDGAAPPQQ